MSLVGYVIGMFPSADLVARLASRGAVDIRQSGQRQPRRAQRACACWARSGARSSSCWTRSRASLAGFVGLAIGDAAAYAAGTAAIAGHCGRCRTASAAARASPPPAGRSSSVFPPIVPDRRPSSRSSCPSSGNGRRSRSCWSARSGWSAAAVWWAADRPMWWGPEPGGGPPDLRGARRPDGPGPLPVARSGPSVRALD